MSKQSGISLLEVLISLFLSSLILTLLIQLYLGSKRQYSAAEDLLETHFDVRWAQELLSDSIRRAGFTPCLGIDKLNLQEEGKIIHGVFWEKKPSLLLQINRMSERFAQVVSVNNIMQITVPSLIKLREKYPVLIADCDHAEIQRISQIEQYNNESVITFVNPLHFTYSKSAYIGEFIREQWFIKNNTLYYKQHQTEEVTPFIRFFDINRQLLHGKSFIEVTLELADASEHKLMVAVRGS